MFKLRTAEHMIASYLDESPKTVAELRALASHDDVPTSGLKVASIRKLLKYGIATAIHINYKFRGFVRGDRWDLWNSSEEADDAISKQLDLIDFKQIISPH